MLYYLLYEILFKSFPALSVLRIFQYQTTRAMGAVLTSLVLVFLITPKLIARLKKIGIGQHIRLDGPKTHLKKEGTPTMGGIAILLSLVISTVLWARLDNKCTIIVLISTVWLGLLGFLDDYIKLIRGNSEGLSRKYKLVGQIVLGLGVGVALILSPLKIGRLWKYTAEEVRSSSYTQYLSDNFQTILSIPFFKDALIPLGLWYVLFVILVIVATSNAVNLTDGLDGLAVGSIISAAFAYTVFSYLTGNKIYSHYLNILHIDGSSELTIFCTAIIGAGLGFLWFNSYPAQIFMGDTGSLFLGGTLGVVALLIKHELILVVVGGVFVAEALSVIIQVASFKMTGKRVFSMSPLHHHFELAGLDEPKITVRFWIVSIILALLSMSTLKLR